jgi:formylmethanofuran dehydrogenase subunit B
MSPTKKLSGGLTPDCPLAREGFRSYSLTEDSPEISGVAVLLDKAIKDASRILEKTKNPLIYISGEISCEEQRAAIAFAERFQTIVDTGASIGGCALPLAIQQTGYEGTDLNDLRKAGCILSWSSDTLVRHPRLLSFGTGIRSQANSLRIIKKDNFSSFASCFHDKRWMARNKSSEIDTPFDLPRKIRSGTYLISQNIIDQGMSAVVELLSFMDEMEGKPTWRGLYLAPGGNSHGAAEMLQSITGYPACLRCSRSTMEFSPQDYAIEYVLKNQESDLIIFMGYPHELSKRVIDNLSNQDTILISATKPKWMPKVQIPVRRCGIDNEGTVLRMDGVAVALEQIVKSYRPDLVTILDAMTRGAGA